MLGNYTLLYRRMDHSLCNSRNRELNMVLWNFDRRWELCFNTIQYGFYLLRVFCRSHFQVLGHSKHKYYHLNDHSCGCGVSQLFKFHWRHNLLLRWYSYVLIIDRFRRRRTILCLHVSSYLSEKEIERSDDAWSQASHSASKCVSWLKLDSWPTIYALSFSLRIHASAISHESIANC